MNTLHSNPKAKPQKRMTGGFICALFLALTFSMLSCNKDKDTGTVVLRNDSEYTSNFWILREIPSQEIFNQYNVTIMPNGDDKKSNIPVGKYEIYVSVTTYPFAGGDSPVFEVKAGKTTTVHFLDVGFYGEWEVVDPK